MSRKTILLNREMEDVLQGAQLSGGGKREGGGWVGNVCGQLNTVLSGGSEGESQSGKKTALPSLLFSFLSHPLFPVAKLHRSGAGLIKELSRGKKGGRKDGRQASLPTSPAAALPPPPPLL